jgi:hypothetical protein
MKDKQPTKPQGVPAYLSESRQHFQRMRQDQKAKDRAVYSMLKSRMGRGKA